ncbi:GNAT family N-acetyltransferase [Syntrophorhabdus aromaticivorans]|uniref:GNAT family N-acetyltransferase n=1 Tax=Syntrophorhabdus aromaticivorans TaxID=328301 RepID=UPI000413AED6|nr:GNAT family N-acetyltransferase [Syntrophorhabdus aromaticivorans]
METLESIIILPSQERYIYPTLAFIRALAVSCDFSEPARNAIEIAAEEALTNVIQHAFEEKADETFKLSVSISSEDFKITIHEKGMPFDPDGVADYNPGKIEIAQQADGLGLYLMKRMMDDVIFENLGREGKSLTLIKRFDEAQKRQITETNRNRTLVKDGAAIPSEKDFYEIRPFRPEDALEISRCAYRAYGYTYEPYIYYPEKIIEMNRSGKLRSFIASGKDSGEIMGHIALKFKNPDDRIAETGVAFVKPEYRKSGILKSMMEFCHIKANELKLYGLSGRAVTSHIYSQKAADSFGYKPCGIMLGLFPSDVDFRAISGRVIQKESGVLLYMNISGKDIRKVYAPSHYKNILSGIFDPLCISVQFNEEGTISAAGKSEIDVNTDSVLNISDVEVCRIGSGLILELRKILHSLCLRHVDAIFLHISIEDAEAPRIIEQAEHFGFFFCGVLPFGLNNTHDMIMQYMNNLDIDYDIIKPYSSHAAGILDCIKAAAADRNHQIRNR